MQFNNKMFVMIFCNFNFEIDYFYHNAHYDSKKNNYISRYFFFYNYFFYIIYLTLQIFHFVNYSFFQFFISRVRLLSSTISSFLSFTIPWKIRSLVCSFILTKSIRIPASCAKYHHFGTCRAQMQCYKFLFIFVRLWHSFFLLLNPFPLIPIASLKIVFPPCNTWQTIPLFGGSWRSDSPLKHLNYVSFSPLATALTPRNHLQIISRDKRIFFAPLYFSIPPRFPLYPPLFVPN